MSDPSRTIAFQGALGAYSDLAGRTAFPAMTSLPCATFEEAFAAVREKRAQLAMLPIDNSGAGRGADINHLPPGSERIRASVAGKVCRCRLRVQHGMWLMQPSIWQATRHVG
jgi:prephenate dehydratase